MGRHDGPYPFALGFFETRRGQLKPVFQLSFMLDKLVEFFTCWSHEQRITDGVPGVQQTGRLSVHYFSITTGKPCTLPVTVYVSLTSVFCDFSGVNVCISGKPVKETRVF